MAKRLYPDTRKVINEIQKFSVDGVLRLPDINMVDSFANTIVDLVLKGKVLEARRYIIENESEFNGDYPQLLKALFDTISNNNLPLTAVQKKMWLITTGEYMYRNSFVVDPEINFYCLLLALSEING